MEDTFYTEEELKELGLKKYGRDVRISKYCIIKYPELVEVGNHIAIDAFVFINTRLKLGSFIHIAPYSSIFGGKDSYCEMQDFSGLSQGVKVICGTDDYSGIALANPTIPRKYRHVTNGKVIFEKYTLIGTNAVILPNVVIGEGTAVGACTLVTKSLDPWGIYVGIPARRLKDRQKGNILKYAKELEHECL